MPTGFRLCLTLTLRRRNWSGLVESCRENQTKLWNVTKLLKHRQLAFGDCVFDSNYERLF
jgi:hypothetical protein